MNPRAVLRLASVLLVAVVAALLLRSLFLASTAEPPPPPTAAIRVATGDLSMGLLLKAEDMAWKEMAPDAVQPGEITRNSALAAKLPGAVLRRPVADGAPIRERDVVFPDAPGFLAAALQPGMRAVSVAIDDVTGNAGLIQPGDYVDLVLTHQLRSEDNSGNDKVASETVLSDMRVIAVGQTLAAVEGEGKPRGSSSARTVTLEVLPRDAEKVAVVTRLGQLSLALRSLARTEQPAAGRDLDGTTPLWGRDVSTVVRMTAEEKPRASRPAAAPPREVKVFRGSGSEK
jgi:Flp pilus assembly protein CpaB